MPVQDVLAGYSRRSRDSAAKMACGQAEKAKDFGDHRGFFDGGDNCHIATTVRAVFDVDIEHLFTKTFLGFRPSDRRSPFKIAPGDFVSKRA